eukprot:gene8676-3504_t
MSLPPSADFLASAHLLLYGADRRCFVQVGAAGHLRGGDVELASEIEEIWDAEAPNGQAGSVILLEDGS